MERRLVPDSEGPGRFCGTPACRVVYGPVAGALRLTYACDGHDNPDRGVQGGRSGAPARQWICRAGGGSEALPPMDDITLEPGDTVTAITTGGGGYGSPPERALERVEADVRERHICRERAQFGLHAVVLDDQGRVDNLATARLRDGACEARALP